MNKITAEERAELRRVSVLEARYARTPDIRKEAEQRLRLLDALDATEEKHVKVTEGAMFVSMSMWREQHARAERAETELADLRQRVDGLRQRTEDLLNFLEES